MALATLTEFEVRLGTTLAGVEADRAQAALDDASALATSIGDSAWTDATVPDDAKAVTLSVARRLFDNPQGYTQQSVGDVSVSGGSGVLTVDERRTLRRAAGRSFTSVTLTSPYSGVAEEELVL